MGLTELLILISILVIIAIVLRVIVAAMNSRKNKIKIALDKNIPEYDLEELELRELPSGGARMVQRSFEEVMRQASELDNRDAAKRRVPRSKVLKTDLSREAVLARRAALLAAGGSLATAEQVREPDLFADLPPADNVVSSDGVAAVNDASVVAAGVDVVDVSVTRNVVDVVDVVDVVEVSEVFEVAVTGNVVDVAKVSEIAVPVVVDTSAARAPATAANDQADADVLAAVLFADAEAAVPATPAALLATPAALLATPAALLATPAAAPATPAAAPAAFAMSAAAAASAASAASAVLAPTPVWAAAAVRADQYDARTQSSAQSYVDENDWLDDVSPVREVRVDRSERSEPTFSEMRFDENLGLVELGSQPLIPAASLAADELHETDDAVAPEETMAEPALDNFDDQDDADDQDDDDDYDDEDNEDDLSDDEEDEFADDDFNDDQDEEDFDESNVTQNWFIDDVDQEDGPEPEAERAVPELDDMLDELLHERGVSTDVDYSIVIPQPVSEIEAEVEAEIEADIVPEPELEIEIEPEPEIVPEPEPEIEAEIEAVIEPEIEAEIEAEIVPESELEIEIEPEPEIVPEPEPEIEAEIEIVPETEPEPAAAVDVEPDQKALEDDEEEPLPDFDSELEVEPEPQPQPVDSFAAVDKKDQIDDLFEDEDQQRRQGALEQEQESAPKRFMSWAGAAFGKLTAGVAASRAGAADQKSAERANASQDKASRKSVNQRADDLHDMDDYADPLDDYTVDRSRGDDPRSASPGAQRDEYQDEFQEEFHEEFQQDSPEYYQRQHSDGHTDEPGDAGYADEYYEEYQSEPRPAEQHYQPPMTEQERKIAKYGESPYTGHRFGVDSVPSDPIAAASAAAASAASSESAAAAASASAAAAASRSPYSDSRTGAASPTQGAGGRATTAPRATSNVTARNARENQLSLDMLQDDDKDSGYSQVLVINVMARPKTSIQGDELLPILLGAGLRFGEVSIFHRHADRKGGPVLFSVANALNPGTFDLNGISDFSTQGVCFFMTLPNVANNMLAFEQMLATAKHMQSVLDAELKDDNRSVMTAQTVEHYRQRIRDFDLQQLKNSKNPRQK